MLYNSNKGNIFIFVVVLQVVYTPNSWIPYAMSLSSVHLQVAGRLQPHRTCRTTGGKTACCIPDGGHCLMQAWARVQLGDLQTQPVRLGRFADINTGRAPELSEHQQTDHQHRLCLLTSTAVFSKESWMSRSYLLGHMHLTALTTSLHACGTKTLQSLNMAFTPTGNTRTSEFLHKSKGQNLLKHAALWSSAVLSVND